MRALAWAIVLGAIGCLAGAIEPADAQQVTVSTPYHAVSDSFFENTGTSWGLRGPNWNLNVFGSPLQAAPQFGGFDPSAGANFGAGFGGGGVNGSFGANWSQGSRRSFTSTTPSVTLQNGMPGSVSDTSQSPFVVGQIPVVGGFPIFGTFLPAPPQQPMPYAPYGTVGGNSAVQQALRQAQTEQRPYTTGAIGRIEVPRPQVVQPQAPAPVQAAPNEDALVLGGSEEASAADVPTDANARRLAGARSSSAGRSAMSVAEARRMYQAEQAGQTDEVLQYIERARGAEAEGKQNVAKIYYEMAYRRATGELRGQIQAKLSALGSSP